MKSVKGSRRFLLLFFIPIAALSFAVACSKKTIDEDTAVKVYVENIIAEEKFSHNFDSLKIHQEFILKKYNTNQHDFESYLKELKDDPSNWEDFFKKSDEYIVELQKEGAIE